MIRILIWLSLFCTITILHSQNKLVTEWINTHSISINCYDENSKLEFSFENNSSKFKNAQIYGFGEASHQHKEFSLIKTQFLNYLVTHNNVKKFYIEESFGAAYNLNEYLQTGEGNPKTLLKEFKQGILKTHEVLTLIEWIRDYNINSSLENKVQFIGMDCMFNYKIVEIIFQICSQNNIILEEPIITILNNYKEEKFEHYSIQNLENEIIVLQDFQEKIKNLVGKKESKKINTAIEALKNYMFFINEPNQETRDEKMATTIAFTIENEKAFVWAHNYHIQKTILPGKGTIPSMGNRLGKTFGSAYYAMGLDFGIGQIKGYTIDNNWQENEISTPVIKTFSSQFFDSEKDNFFLIFEEANSNSEMNTFLNTNGYYLGIGAYGIHPKNIKYNLLKGKLQEMYDGIIFVKKVTLSTNLE